MRMIVRGIVRSVGYAWVVRVTCPLGIKQLTRNLSRCRDLSFDRCLSSLVSTLLQKVELLVLWACEWFRVGLEPYPVVQQPGIAFEQLLRKSRHTAR